MSQQFNTGGPAMDSTETLLRERFAEELAQVSPDISSNVAGGVQIGRRMRRWRQLTTGVVAAVAVVAASAVGYATLERGLFDNDSTGPAEPVYEQLVPATPRGVAAAVLAHLPDGYEGGVAGTYDESDDVPLSVTVGVSREMQAELHVMASPETGEWDAIIADECSQVTCVKATTPEGIEVVTFETRQDEASVVAAAALRESDIVVSVLAYLTEGNDAPLTAGDLTDIVTDPLVGMQTSDAMNTQGLEITDWYDEYPIPGSSFSDTESSVEVSPGTATGGAEVERTAEPPPAGNDGGR